MSDASTKKPRSRQRKIADVQESENHVSLFDTVDDISSRKELIISCLQDASNPLYSTAQALDSFRRWGEEALVQTDESMIQLLLRLLNKIVPNFSDVTKSKLMPFLKTLKQSPNTDISAMATDLTTKWSQAMSVDISRLAQLVSPPEVDVLPEANTQTSVTEVDNNHSKLAARRKKLPEKTIDASAVVAPSTTVSKAQSSSLKKTNTDFPAATSVLSLPSLKRKPHTFDDPLAMLDEMDRLDTSKKRRSSLEVETKVQPIFVASDARAPFTGTPGRGILKKPNDVFTRRVNFAADDRLVHVKEFEFHPDERQPFSVYFRELQEQRQAAFARGEGDFYDDEGSDMMMPNAAFQRASNQKQAPETSLGSREDVAILSRPVGASAPMKEQVIWRVPAKLIVPESSLPRDIRSQEASAQRERENNTLAVVYLSAAHIPASPGEAAMTVKRSQSEESTRIPWEPVMEEPVHEQPLGMTQGPEMHAVSPFPEAFHHPQETTPTLLQTLQQQTDSQQNAPDLSALTGRLASLLAGMGGTDAVLHPPPPAFPSQAPPQEQPAIHHPLSSLLSQIDMTMLMNLAPSTAPQYLPPPQGGVYLPPQGPPMMAGSGGGRLPFPPPLPPPQSAPTAHYPYGNYPPPPPTHHFSPMYPNGPPGQPQARPANYKTSVCKYFKSSMGCRFGDGCSFIHE